MADRLYLSLWYPNFRLETLPDALAGVLRQFAQVGAKRISAASVYPINFTESPTYQRIYVESPPANFDPTVPIDPSTETSDERIDAAVAEATEQLHDDMAYEFEMRWQLWTQEGNDPAFSPLGLATSRYEDDADPDLDASSLNHPDDDDWRLRSHTVRILGFGPSFDVAGYEQNGHLLVDFGIDTPWVPNPPRSNPALQTLEDEALDETAQIHIQQNVEKLLAFTLLIEKNCGISSRLLWTESGKPLAEKLIARLQRVH
jgi:hypothetical protein